MQLTRLALDRSSSLVLNMIFYIAPGLVSAIRPSSAGVSNAKNSMQTYGRRYGAKKRLPER